MNPERPIQLPRVHFRGNAGEQFRLSQGGDWALLEWEAENGEEVEIEVDTTGPVRGLGLVASGGKACILSEPVVATTSNVKAQPLRIAGLSASHDSSACVLENGKLKSAIQLERLTRKKHDGKPYLHSARAADYCLDATGITASQIDAFGLNLRRSCRAISGYRNPPTTSRLSSSTPSPRRQCMYRTIWPTPSRHSPQALSRRRP